MDIKTFLTSIQAIKTHLIDEFSRIRTGRVSSSMVDIVRVDAYGSLTPLNQVGTITIEDAKTIKISPWDSSLISAIEKGVLLADLGVTTSVSDGGVRIHFPDLTGETRDKFTRNAKEKHEEARIALRNERNKIMNEVDAQKKNGDIGEDDARQLKETIESHVSECNKDFDELFSKKKNEIMTI